MTPAMTTGMTTAMTLGTARAITKGKGSEAALRTAPITPRSGGAPPHDKNLRSAYLLVLADAAISLAAIFALAGGWWFGWIWLDPAIGIAGAVLVAVWARGLLRDTGKVLLDREMDHPVVDEIRQVVDERGAASDTLITDLHMSGASARAAMPARWAC
jgi:Co/Zn/Cd efflux system component